MSTSTSAIEDTLRARLLTFVPLAGDGLVAVLGVATEGSGVDGKLYWRNAPDKIDSIGKNPVTGAINYGIMALKNRRRDAEQAEREMADFEVMLFGRPDKQKATLELAADIIEQAMLRYVDGTVGLLGCWGSLRNALPPFASPADRDVVQIQLVFTLVLWPAYKTQYHDQPRY